MKFKRTHTCADLRAADVGTEVVLQGWVDNMRDHGGVIFIDLGDRYGTTQIVIDPDLTKEGHELANSFRNQFVISVKGEVKARPDGQANPKMETGEVEIYVKDVELLNKSVTPPYDIHGADKVNEEIRLKNRFFDLRARKLRDNMIFRDRATSIIRNFFHENDFVDVETPILTKATPEGARDYVVPSRVHQGQFFALPQSPQLFKQSLMISGFDRYIQIARCFRDEDLRADRQPEFTQVDMEMSFVDREDVMGIIEGLFSRLFKEMMGLDIPAQFPRLTYKEAMDKYGNDRPDLRFGLEINDLGDIFANTEFGVFKNVLASGGLVRGINLKGAAEKLSRRDLDEMTPFVKQFKAKGVAWIRMNEDGPQSPIIKFLSDEEQRSLYEFMGAETGDILIFVADTKKVCLQSLSELRLLMGEKLGLIDENEFNFSWVIDFPMFEKNAAGEPTPSHHPFTAPVAEHLDTMEEDPFAVLTNAYDVILNGIEVGGGSVRIHDQDVQKRVFAMLGIDEAEAADKFGFLLDALQAGAPPHAGLALGLDRLIMLMLKLDSIRDVIAFPKTQKATCLMTEAPGSIPEAQMEELALESTVEDEA